MSGRDQDLLGSRFPIEGLMTMSAYVIGMAGIAVGRLCLGYDWVASALLYFPFFALTCGLINNETRRTIEAACLLVLYPAVLSVSGVLASRVLPLVSACEAVNAQTMALLVKGGVTVLLFFAFSAVAKLVAVCLGNWRFPRGVHEAIVRILLAGVCTTVLFVAVWGVRLLNLKFQVLGSGLAFGLPILFAIVYMFCLSGIFRSRISLLPKGSSDGKAASGVRLTTIPNVHLADVAGMEEVKRQIRLRLIEPVRDARRARRYGIGVGGGLLLYGPPGTGKTFIAKAVAGELGLPFFAITAADVFGKYVGESEGNVRRIFGEVRKHRLSVVFIDELETLFPKRTGDVHESTRKVISVLLQELDGIDSGKNPVLLLGATNVPWMIDEAFMRPGRFDMRVFVGLPDVDARRQMFVSAFAKGSVPHAAGLVSYLAERTENYSGADINGVMTRLRQTAYERRLPAYTEELADEALASTAPSATGDILDGIREWEAQSVGEKAKNAIRGGTCVAERPTTTFDDVAGMADVKEQVRLRIIEPMRNQTLAGKYGLTVGGGVLLYGPPGTGKTFFARAVAGELELPFYLVTAADIFAKYVGESERNVRKLFNDIRKNPLSVVFIDELETLFPKRTGDVHESTRKVISVLLQELDGIDKSKNPILLLGATNVPWMIDEAFLRPGRFDAKVFVGLPDFAARRQMLITAFDEGDVPHEPGLTAHMAEKTDGYSGADLRGVMTRLRQVAFDRRLTLYTYDFADEILAASSPTTNAENVRRIQAWGQS